MIKTHFKLMYGWLMVIPLLFVLYITGQTVLFGGQAVDHTRFAFDVDASVIRIITFFVALQAAFIFAPDHDPSLELVLSYPQATQQVFLKRFGLSLFILVVSALIVTVNPLMPLTAKPLEFIAYWFVASLFLIGVIALMVQISKQGNFGLLMALGLWFGLSFGAPILMERFAWFVYLNPFLLPNHELFWWNRLLMLVLALGSLGWCWLLLHNTERLLQGR